MLSLGEMFGVSWITCLLQCIPNGSHTDKKLPVDTGAAYNKIEWSMVQLAWQNFF